MKYWKTSSTDDSFDKTAMVTQVESGGLGWVGTMSCSEKEKGPVVEMICEITESTTREGNQKALNFG